MSNLFDPNSFLEASIDVALERREPLPVGDYTAVIAKAEGRRWTTDKPDAKTKEGVVIDLQLEVQIPPEVVERLAYTQNTLTVKDGIMLELNDNGGIDTGKGRNGKLRTYRDATEQNVAGQLFKPSMLVGRVVLVKITHEMYNNNPIEKVGGVARKV